MLTADKHTALVYGYAQDFVHTHYRHLSVSYHEVMHCFESGTFEQFVSVRLGAFYSGADHGAEQHPGYWTDFHQEVLADAVDSADLNGVFDADL